MKKERTIFDYSPKSRRSKTREISSRFLSPTSSMESGISSPTHQALSPVQRKPTDSRKNRISLEDSGPIRSGVWPSSSKKVGTLADHLGNDRLKEFIDHDDRKKQSSSNNGPQFLSKQRSCSEFNRFDKEKQSTKENHRPSFGGSMRYTGKLLFPGKFSSSKSSSFSNIIPGRLSVDESNLNRRRNSDSFAETLSSESECSTDCGSKNSSSSSTYLASTASSRRLAGVEVPSRYLHDALTRSSSHRISTTSSNSNNLPPKRANSLSAYKSTISQWALSPGRSGSPPMSVENKGKPVVSFSSLRPPHSPSRSKGVSSLFSLGLDLFKSKKSPVGENGHELRMNHNRLAQWRYVNARADAVNATKMKQAESTLLNAWVILANLQSSVIQKRIQFEKEKLEAKMNNILQSQVEPLEAWGDMERQHLLTLSTTTGSLHSVVCRVPLIGGAKVDPQPTSIALRHAVDVTTSIKALLNDFSPAAQKEGELLRELAKVVIAEKSLLKECFDLVEMLSALETKERSLQCGIVQLKSQQQQHCQSRRHPQDIVT